jgi:hypothetical protein
MESTTTTTWRSVCVLGVMAIGGCAAEGSEAAPPVDEAPADTRPLGSDARDAARESASSIDAQDSAPSVEPDTAIDAVIDATLDTRLDTTIEDTALDVEAALDVAPEDGIDSAPEAGVDGDAAPDTIRDTGTAHEAGAGAGHGAQ